MFEAQIDLLKQARKKNTDATDGFFQIRRTGRKVEVAEALKQVVDFDPTWIDARYQYGLSLLKLGRHRDAIPHFQMCASTHEEWMPALSHLGLCYLKSGNEYLGLSMLKSILDMDPDADIPEYSKVYEIVADEYFKKARKEKNKLIRDGVISELKSMCERDVERNGERPWSSLYLAAIEYYYNKVESALELFEKAALLADPYRTNYPIVHKSAYGCFTVRSLGQAKKIFESKGLPEIQISFDAPCATNLVFLLGCDEGYFRRFSEFLISSVIRSNNNILVHFHIIGLKENIVESLEAVRVLAETGHNVSVKYSFEPKPSDATTTYYAMSRFIVVHQIMKHYGSDVVIGDIDSAVVGSLAKVQSYVGNCDVGVNASTNPDSFKKFPWNSISGGYMFFKNSPLGISYARDLSKFMLGVYDSASAKSWWLDQSALFTVTQYYIRNQPKFKFKSFIGSDAPQPFMHNPVGKSKDEFAKMVMGLIASGEFSAKYGLKAD
ncbi:tetratricopeptide repeat protein [Pseudomonas alloputida]|uniref:tetratricopeptide repeat protein n=1 Tax=Pseudomonas alloputida TaxID=1940621 RepID=UPI0011C47B39|nr:tetratricopeptide repeat protein [Pseudomonas alloputida]MCE1052788.1 tetratricopeptide repeat protein [Pseudomonas alloputida]